MKKLLLLLFIVPLLAACGSDNNDEVDTNVYIDKSVIIGDWYKIEGWDSIVWSFNEKSVLRLTYDRYNLTLKQKFGNSSYRITKDRVLFDKAKKGRLYRIVKDTLFFTGDSGDNSPFGKYTRVK